MTPEPNAWDMARELRATNPDTVKLVAAALGQYVRAKSLRISAACAALEAIGLLPKEYEAIEREALRSSGLEPPEDSDYEPFDRRVVKMPNGCWEWTGFRDGKSYGRITLWENKQGIKAYTHRRAYELAKRPIPKGMYVCHTCDNPPCCNPDHLFLGSQTDNMRDMIEKGRNFYLSRTHCARGHKYTQETTYRVCKICVKLNKNKDKKA